MRIEDWDRSLRDYIARAATEPFAWGEHDCALWVSSFCDEVTGSDFASEWRGKYKTEAGAAKLMRSRGYKSVADIASDKLREKPVAFAQRGDAVLHPDGHLGLCDGRLSYFLTDGGVLSIPTLSCPRAWAV